MDYRREHEYVVRKIDKKIILVWSPDIHTQLQNLYHIARIRRNRLKT